jgi:hypothetical protein
LALPEDSAETYAERADRLLLQGQTSGNDGARDVVKRYYDVDPAWVPVTYAGKGLYPWEAGCTWYAENANDSPSIQLTTRFQHAQDYLCLYQKDEVLAHEYVHAVRAPLGSAIFEEIFSYLISLNFSRGLFGRALQLFRTFFGPIFEQPSESLFFVSAFSLFLVVTISALFSSSYEGTLVSICLVSTGILCAVTSAYFLGRLLVRWWQWWRCKVHLQAIAGNDTLALMLRLCDEEIVLFSHLKIEEIIDWIGDQKEMNFRWQLLASAYIK